VALTKEQPNMHLPLSSRWVTTSPMVHISHSLIVIAVCCEDGRSATWGRGWKGNTTLIGGAYSRVVPMEGEIDVVTRKEGRF
jgi:hypothetical protein